MASTLRPIPRADAALGPRALSLLAADVPRETGARFLAGAPMPRRGFLPAPALRATLRRLAASPRPAPDPVVAERERNVGREVLAVAFRRDQEGKDVAEALDAVGPAEAAAAMALAPLLSEAAATASRPAPIGALLRAALMAAPGPERLRALGAMHLGASGEGPGDAVSARWRSAGEEIGAMQEAGCLA